MIEAMLTTELDADAITALLADVAAANDPADPRATLLRRLFRTDEVAAVHDPTGAGAMLRQALTSYGGAWTPGEISGALEAAGWGAAMGLKGVRWDPAGDPLPVQVVRAPSLAAAWPVLDAFQLGAYRRILVPVRTVDQRLIVANLYALS